jgi:hypothetical protein
MESGLLRSLRKVRDGTTSIGNGRRWRWMLYVQGREDGSLNLVEEPPYSGGVMYSPTMSRTFSTYSDSLRA